MPEHMAQFKVCLSPAPGSGWGFLDLDRCSEKTHHKEGEKMNLQQPMSEEFANAFDRTCGRMIDLGLEEGGNVLVRASPTCQALVTDEPRKSQTGPEGA